jgi:hypothetical protein
LQPDSHASKILGDFQLVDYRGAAAPERNSSSEELMLQYRHDYLERRWKSDDKDFPSMQKRASVMSDMIRDERSKLPADLTEDRFAIDNAADAVLNGRPEALTNALAAYRNDPDKLQRVVNELERQFTDQGSGVRLEMQQDGLISVKSSSNVDANYALTVDPNHRAVKGTFSTRGRAMFDGAEERDPEDVARRMAANAVEKIANHRSVPPTMAPHLRNDRGPASPMQIYR